MGLQPPPPLHLTWSQLGADPSWDDATPYPVVWVDVARFDAAWSSSEDYIPHGGTGFPRYPGTLRWLFSFAVRQRPVWMPTIGFVDGVPEFTDGRHRTAWLRDHGATSLPVECDPETVHALRRICGTATAETTFQLTWLEFTQAAGMLLGLLARRH